jgi:hypothetical protein
MMGHREKLKTVSELDVVCRKCRRQYGPKAGVIRYWKRVMRRRTRRDVRRALNHTSEA